jgi:hypothetical protein
MCFDKAMTANKITGANSRPASPFRGGVAVPERVVSAGVVVGRLSLSSGRSASSRAIDDVHDFRDTRQRPV